MASNSKSPLDYCSLKGLQLVNIWYTGSSDDSNTTIQIMLPTTRVKVPGWKPGVRNEVTNWRFNQLNWVKKTLRVEWSPWLFQGSTHVCVCACHWLSSWQLKQPNIMTLTSTFVQFQTWSYKISREGRSKDFFLTWKFLNPRH